MSTADKLRALGYTHGPRHRNEDTMIRYLLPLMLAACTTVHETEPEPPACDVAPVDIALPSGCYEDEPACEPSWADMDPAHAPCVRHYVCGGSCVTAFNCECVAEVQAECGAPLPVACGGV
jgi:hypothetical protein